MIFCTFTDYFMAAAAKRETQTKLFSASFFFYFLFLCGRMLFTKLLWRTKQALLRATRDNIKWLSSENTFGAKIEMRRENENKQKKKQKEEQTTSLWFAQLTNWIEEARVEKGKNKWRCQCFIFLCGAFLALHWFFFPICLSFATMEFFSLRYLLNSAVGHHVAAVTFCSCHNFKRIPVTLCALIINAICHYPISSIYLIIFGWIKRWSREWMRIWKWNGWKR